MNTLKTKRVLESLQRYSSCKKRIQENYKKCLAEEKEKYDRIRPEFKKRLQEAYISAVEDLNDDCQEALEACYDDGQLCYIVKDVCEPDGTVMDEVEEDDMDCTVDCLISLLREKLGDHFNDVMRRELSDKRNEMRRRRR